MLNPTDLLSRLGSGIRPAGAPGIVQGTARGGALSGQIDFGSLLESARATAPASGRSVEAGRNSGIELSTEEADAVNAAADRAEAAGAQRALVVVGDRALEVDVPGRQITSEIDLMSGDPITGIDTVVRAPLPGEAIAPTATSREVLDALFPAGMNSTLIQTLGAATRGGADER